ncbi:MAG: biotin--[acetyl-CoA-carboxylase] ligase [Lachnospiraceae bacterium]|nr:biotin--[acetyl-CoA-carboxylase] ligase [Lachnospiraceae bacterium]
MKETTKENVLKLLSEHNSNFVSGQEIADTLYITRAGIWKAVNALRKDGYNIEAVTNKGYRLRLEKDILSLEGVQRNLDKDGIEIKVNVYDEVASTNDLAKEYAVSHSDDIVMIANYQTKGRGRRGRSFFSPKGCGLYISFLLHPKTDIEKATQATCMAAVAVCKAIEKLTGKDVKIKWVNDIFLDGKKICGILTEGATSLEDGSLSYMVIGIGINLYIPKDGFPDEIKNIAGVLFPEGELEEDMKNRLSAGIIRELTNLLGSGDIDDYLEDYRSRSMLIGNYVKILNGGTVSGGYGKVEGIDDECHLIVRRDNGEVEALSSGEVSVVRY